MHFPLLMQWVRILGCGLHAGCFDVRTMWTVPTMVMSSFACLCVFSGVFPGVSGQSDALLSSLQEESLHVGSSAQQEEHAGEPAALDSDSDLLPSAVSETSQWTGRQQWGWPAAHTRYNSHTQISHNDLQGGNWLYKDYWSWSLNLVPLFHLAVCLKATEMTGGQFGCERRDCVCVSTYICSIFFFI